MVEGGGGAVPAVDDITIEVVVVGIMRVMQLSLFMQHSVSHMLRVPLRPSTAAFNAAQFVVFCEAGQVT